MRYKLFTVLVLIVLGAKAQCIDPAYSTLMTTWNDAGVTGGIPTKTVYSNVSVSGSNIASDINGTTTLQAEINAANAAGGGSIVFAAGTYPITSTIEMKSNVELFGISNNSTIFEITIRSTNMSTAAFNFATSVTYAGIRNVYITYKITGCEPNDDLNPSFPSGGTQLDKFNYYYTTDPCGLTNLKVTTVFFRNGANNNWISDSKIIKSGSSAIEMFGNNNTIKGNTIDRAYNKGSGGHGYVAVYGNRNLIINNDIRRLRHVTWSSYDRAYTAQYNVFYNNFLTVDLNPHDGGLGSNLAEKNTITVQNYQHQGGKPFVTGQASSGHDPPPPNDFFYNNNDDASFNPMTPSRSIIYQFTDYQTMVATALAQPTCGTFYTKELVINPSSDAPPVVKSRGNSVIISF
jgi:hypothetical protein